jgi:hypothetical protein
MRGFSEGYPAYGHGPLRPWRSTSTDMLKFRSLLASSDKLKVPCFQQVASNGRVGKLHSWELGSVCIFLG